MHTEVVSRADTISGYALSELMEAPERIFDLSTSDMYSLPDAAVAEYQLGALHKRFATLQPRIPVLAKLAEEQQVDSIRKIEDGARLLFQHSVYKSYPGSFIEKSQFDRMTKWLGNLTSHDLSGLDTRSCRSIDEWLACLDAATALRVVHSSGTSGKLSFIPTSTVEMTSKLKALRTFFQGFHGEPDTDVSGYETAPTIYMGYRSGAMAHHRILDALRDELYGGDESQIHALFPDRMSADVLSLSGRMQAADAQGERGRLQIPASLSARREEFVQQQRDTKARVGDFFERLDQALRGRLVTLYASPKQILDFAATTNMTRMFHRRSFVLAGAKSDLPAGWEDRIMKFLGAENYRQGFGMTELTAPTRACVFNSYHLPPAYVAYLLDPKSGALLPRNGTATGRLGVIDLAAQTYWGGFLTGDEVTISWDDTRCACGRLGPRLHQNIRRYTPAEGGDDKITCAGAPQAHENTLAFLASKLE